MACLNKVQLIGNLGRDPEVRYTQSGTAVAVFSMAMTDKVKGEDRTEWMEVEAWDKLADICQKFLAKGRQVYVEGRFKTEKWNDREGTPRSKVKVVATNLVLLGSRQNGDGGNPNFSDRDRTPAPAPAQSTARPLTEEDPITDDDIPF